MDLAGELEMTPSQIKQYSPTVHSMVGQIIKKCPNKQDYDDYIQLGWIGVIKALKSHNPSRGMHLKTYVAKRIKGNILDGMREQDAIGRQNRRAYKQLMVARKHCQQYLFREPTHSEIAKEAGISAKEYHFVMSVASQWSDQNIEQFQDWHSLTRSLDYFDCRAIELALSALNERELTIVKLYYIEEYTEAEIGKELGVSYSRVSQMKTELIYKMRKALGLRIEN